MPPSLYYLVMTPQSDQNSSLHSILRKLCSKLLFKGFIVSNYVSLFFFLMSFNNSPLDHLLFPQMYQYLAIYSGQHFQCHPWLLSYNTSNTLKKKKKSHLLYLPKVFQIQPLLHHSASLILAPLICQLLNHFN